MFAGNSIIGLDIGSESVKMTEIRHQDDGSKELVTYGAAKHNLDLNGYWDSSILRPLSTIIEDILDSGSFEGVKTVMSVKSQDVYVTTMDFDKTWSKKRIEDEINKQAPYFLPYPPDEMRLSWSLITDDPNIIEKTGRQRVIINALPDFVIDNSKNILEHVNLDGVALENQTVSEVRAALQGDQGNTVLVDVGGESTTFSIIVNGILRSSSHIGAGTDKIDEDLAEALGVPTPVAGYFKKDLGLVNLYHLPKQVVDSLSILRSELETFVQLNKKVGQTPSKIVFTGGGVYTPGFIEFFKDFEVPIYLGNCISTVKVTDNVKPYIMPMVNQLSTSIGLALRDDV